MITQVLMNTLTELMVFFVAALPPLPTEYATAIAAATDAAHQFGTYLSLLGPLIPWDVVGYVLQWWLGLLAFYVAMQVVRLILWLIGR